MLFQPTRYCPYCGEQLIEIHNNYGTILVGDTFMGYEHHKCKDALEVFKNISK